ncbi:MAG: D-alanyl-D-alanine carboxypeptidase [bacterium]|nr:D-alanyl-D-alanine carboxypeptidase [bacterium]
MRKFITFCIVLLIQLSIIYGIYRWYVSYETDKDTATAVKEKIEPAVENNLKQIDKKIIPEKKQVIENKQKTQIKKTENKTLSFSIDKPGKPYTYRYADWGNISSLPLSKLARTGILVNIDTGNVLWAKKCRTPVPIASMTKMMTILLVMEEVKNNPDFSLNTEIQVTNEAYKIGGSQVYLDPREKFTVKQLLKAVIIKSANDSAYLLAQYLGGGDVNSFVAKMNKKAKEIGMPNAHYSNPDGLPEKYSSNDNKATAEGLVFLAERLLQFPLVVKDAQTKLGYFREGSKKPMMLINTNKLVRSGFPGITGMKTGYIRRSGFCLTATCERGGKRLVAVVTGFKSSKDRDKFVKQLLNWGYKRNAEIKN